MSDRRSTRKRNPIKAVVTESVKNGFLSLIQGNEEQVASMLDAKPTDDLLDLLCAVMAVNSLTPENVLAQWFSKETLAAYASALGKSSKGNEAALAARIASAWSQPGFTFPQRSASTTEPPSKRVKLESVSSNSSDQLADEMAKARDQQAISACILDLTEPPVDRGILKCTSLEAITKEDADLSSSYYSDACSGKKLAGRALQLLKLQDGTHTNLGYKVNLFEHGLQTATRAYRDGADEEMVVVALLHDIGELHSPSNHGEIAAGILRPYISEKAWWILAHHEVFQGYYYYHHMGVDRETRQVYKESPHFQACVDFCQKYDQPSFDPAYESMNLEEFVPMVEHIFSRKPYFFDPTHPKACAVTG